MSLSVQFREDSLTFENIEIEIGDSLLQSHRSFPIEVQLTTGSLKLGQHKIRISAVSGNRVENKSLTFSVLSNQVPLRYTYEVVNTYPHDDKAYTQGLIYWGGFLYEGTGQKQMSTLRKVELKSGKVVNKIKLNGELFGEGICMHENKIYQLTWSSQVGFIYNADTFEELGRFYYTGEGWGITSDGVVIYRSDGSHKIYKHHPDDFRVLDILEVCSDRAFINNLNELEYIDGKIYANIWQSDDIAIIDPKSGMLEARLGLKKILPGRDRDARTEVLNGIAYDEEGNRIFVTGKYWKKLFEIRIPERES